MRVVLLDFLSAVFSVLGVFFFFICYPTYLVGAIVSLVFIIVGIRLWKDSDETW